jgi:SAM-dependent methyltransferase
MSNTNWRLRSVPPVGSPGTNRANVFAPTYRASAAIRPESVETNIDSSASNPTIATYVAFVRNFILQRRVETVVEIGCGDFAIGQRFAEKVQRYLGVDESSDLIARNRATFGSATIQFAQADARQDDLPPSDLCLIQQVFGRLDNASIEQILTRVTAHRFVLVTEHLPAPARMTTPNLDKRSGPGARLAFHSGVFVEHPPFSRQGETVLSLPAADPRMGPGDLLRTTLLTHR